jgi:rhamnose transport system permease protein
VDFLRPQAISTNIPDSSWRPSVQATIATGVHRNQTILKVFPSVKLIMAFLLPLYQVRRCSSAERRDIKVIGLSLPNICKPYVHDGWVETVVLWNTRDLGYLTVYAGSLLARNQMAPGAKSIRAGRLGTLEVRGSEIILGAPLVMNKSNIDKFDF